VQDQFGKPLSGPWLAQPPICLQEGNNGTWTGFKPPYLPEPIGGGGAVQDPVFSKFPTDWWTTAFAQSIIDGAQPVHADAEPVDFTYRVLDGDAKYYLQKTNHRVMTLVNTVRTWTDHEQ
jgi:hypothetical protein